MEFKVIWSKPALQDLESILRFIATDNPSAATRLGESILQKTRNLEHNPEMGRVVVEQTNPRFRELILAPFRIIYFVNHKPTTIEILRIWHSARGIPKLK